MKAVLPLRHPHLLKVYGAGKTGDYCWIAKEYIHGESLAAVIGRIDAAGKIDWRNVLKIGIYLARALDYAHQISEGLETAYKHGVVHRDIKPQNIVINSKDTVKITDFGLARRLDDGAGLTRTGMALGTPGYMAPEQAQGLSSAVGISADVYALGAILYELLTGRAPFHAETPAKTIQQVISQDPVSPSRLNASVPRDLETICLRCLHKEPHLRYASAAALADDLHRFLRDEVIAARPEGKLGWLARQIRRRPKQSATIAAGALLTVAVVGSGLWLLSDRAAAARAVQADRAATERAAEQDLGDMEKWLRQSAWPEASAALDRAKVRLGDRASIELRRRLDQGAGELELAEKLDAIRPDLTIVGFKRLAIASQTAYAYEDAFRKAGLGQVDDDAEEPGVEAAGLVELLDRSPEPDEGEL